MKSNKLILIIGFLGLMIVASTGTAYAAHWITGTVSDFAGPPPVTANDRTIYLYYPGDPDNYATDIIGTTGRSHQSNMYMIDAMMIPNHPWEAGDTLMVEVRDPGDGYGTTAEAIVTTGAGYESAPTQTLTNALPEAWLTAVSPNQGNRGMTLDVTIYGENTTFVSGTTGANFGANITVNSVTVTDAETAVANITIDIGAVLGLRDVSTTNPNLTLVNGFTVTSEAISEGIDHYEGFLGIGNIGPDGINRFVNTDPGSSPPTAAVETVEIHDGAKAIKVLYSYVGGWGGMVGGILPSSVDISAQNALRFYVKGDGSANTIRLDVVEYDPAESENKGETWQSPEYPLSNTAWQEIVVPYSQLTLNIYAGTPIKNQIFDPVIIRYGLMYIGTNTSAAYHYVDTIDAISTEESSATVTSVSITREADTVGSSVKLTWVTDPVGTAVDIWTISGDPNTDVFTTTAGSWTKEFSNVSGTEQSDANQVGQGTQKYYKVVIKDTTLTDAMLSQQVVGKFDIAVSATDITRVFFSLPVSPESSSILSIIGGQGENGDIVATIDTEYNPIDIAMCDGAGGWLDIGLPYLGTLEVGYGYAYIASVDKYITVVGKVNDATSNTRPVIGDAKANFIGTCYPVRVLVNVDSTGLNGTDNGTIFALIKNDINVGEMDMHGDGTDWTNLLNEPPAIPMTMEPGRGYYLLFPSEALDRDWIQSKPY